MGETREGGGTLPLVTWADGKDKEVWLGVSASMPTFLQYCSMGKWSKPLKWFSQVAFMDRVTVHGSV